VTGISASAPDRYEIPFLIGVVGHRDLLPAEVPQIRAAIATLLARLRTDHPHVPLRLLSSLAAGTDLLAAEVGAEMGIPITALLPYERSLCRRDLDSGEDRARFDRLCHASDVVELELPRGASPLDIERPGELRDGQFQRAGALIARYSGLLIAVWNGESTDHRAGTARTVEFRRHGAMPGDELTTGFRDLLLSAQDDDLIFEIRCGRVSIPDRNGVLVLGFTGNGIQGGLDEPKALRTTLARLAELNRDMQEFAGDIDTQGQGLSTRSPAPVAGALRHLDRLFTAADWMGSHYRRCFTMALKARYGLWALMAFLLIAFKKDSVGRMAMVCILGVLAVFLCGTLLALWAHRRAWHRKYLDYRALAEALRVDFYWEVAGVRKEYDGEFAHESFLQKQDIELQWIRSAMRAVSLHLAIRPCGDFDRGFPFVFGDWVGGESGNSGQLSYYRERLRGLKHTVHVYETIDRALLLGGLILAVTFAVDVASRSGAGSFLPEHLRSTLLWGLALVPVYAAIFEIYLNEKADRALIRQYRYMSSLFGFAARELRTAGSVERKLKILRSLGRACLAEHAQWILAHRDKRIQGMRW
jgi:hypothetical protein